MNNNFVSEKRFYEKFKLKGLSYREAWYKASDAVRKLSYKKFTKEYFQDKIEKGGYDRLKNMCEHVLLRPNDNKRVFGEKGFNNLKEICEELLENYRDTDLYKYYYELPTLKYKGLCTLERWKGGYLQ